MTSGLPTGARPPAEPLPRYRIIGSGPVGLACALWLARAGVAPARIRLESRRAAEPATPAAPATAGPPTVAGPPRRIALSEGSCQILGRITRVPPGGRIARIDVVQNRTSGRTRILAREFGVPELGRVVAWTELVAALRAAASAAGLLVDDTAPAAETPPAGDEETSGGRAFPRETITIHAEGQPPGESGDRIEVRDFGQAALLTEIEAATTTETAGLAGQIAYECFGEHGPLALLPIDDPASARAGHAAGPVRYTVVWCDREARSRARAGQSGDTIAAELEAAFAAIIRDRARPAGFRLVAPVAVMPLARWRRRRIVNDDAVWIGNAAQALHPVAGQGLNLGLRDAFELARLLGEAELAGNRQPVRARLAAYARTRATDRRLTTGLTDLLAASFTWPLARPVQSALLTCLDLSTMLRRPLAGTLLFGTR